MSRRARARVLPPTADPGTDTAAGATVLFDARDVPIVPSLARSVADDFVAAAHRMHGAFHRARSRLEGVRQSVRALEDALSRVKQALQTLQRQEEELVLDLAGPPRRPMSVEERATSDQRHVRMAELRREVAGTEASVASARGRETRLAQSVQALHERTRTAVEKVRACVRSFVRAWFACAAELRFALPRPCARHALLGHRRLPWRRSLPR